MIDITKARLVHLKWLLQLEKKIRHEVPQELESCRICELGKWIYSEAIEKYGSYPEISFLEKRHRRFHETADLLVTLYRERNFVEAEVALDELKRDSQDLIFMLTMFEYRYTGFGETC
ncbi:MAG: CZB domain-containing protein [Alphaproteobacteria bacterium]|nr:CZB domain-containing protein [Alphaproteobacteria bacterium]